MNNFDLTRKYNNDLRKDQKMDNKNIKIHDNKKGQKTGDKINSNYRNSYTDELKRFLRKHVTVIGHNGEEYNGLCIAINFSHLNVILKTSTEKIIVKQITSIRRLRSSKGGSETLKEEEK